MISYFSERKVRIWRPKSVSILRSAKTLVLQGRDVINRVEDTSVMVEKKVREPWKTYCVAGGRNAVNCANKSGIPGITMHYFPSDETLREKWTRFFRIHRKDFVPSKKSALCSAHFDEKCFHFKSVDLFDEDGKPLKQRRRHLVRGSIPFKDTVVPYNSPLTSRKRRMVSTLQCNKL